MILSQHLRQGSIVAAAVFRPHHCRRRRRRRRCQRERERAKSLLLLLLLLSRSPLLPKGFSVAAARPTISICAPTERVKNRGLCNECARAAGGERQERDSLNFLLSFSLFLLPLFGANLRNYITMFLHIRLISVNNIYGSRFRSGWS
jgi:hypothetical protein